MNTYITRKGKNGKRHKAKLVAEEFITSTPLEGDRDYVDVRYDVYFYLCIKCNKRVERDRVLFRKGFLKLSCRG